jgi:quinoprotein glucose dehydrogenase
VLYFTAGQRRSVVAANAGTGETLWIWRPDEGERFDRAPRKVHRGVAYWSDGRGDDRIVLVTPGFNLVSLNAKTGQPVPGFGQTGTVDLFKHLDLDVPLDPTGRIGNSSPPVISNDVIVIGPALTPGGRVNKSNVKGDILAFDVRTGRKLWTFHTIPREGEPGYESWKGDSAQYTGNAGVWGPFSADPELGYVYLSIESATNDVYGGHRPGNNLFSDSLVCLDIKTGKMIWYQQLVHHDIWDYDMPPHPILVNLTVDGKPVRAVVQLTKQAFAYVFDRTNGRPVFGWTEKAVPQTDVPKEWTSPTQPFPNKPKGFDVQGITIEDLIDFTPELRAEAVKAIESYKIGPIYCRARAGRRCQLARRGGRCRNRLRLCRVDDDARTDRTDPERRSEGERRRFRLHDGWRGTDNPRSSSAEAAVRTHHGVRHEQGRDRLADSER